LQALPLLVAAGCLLLALNSQMETSRRMKVVENQLAQLLKVDSQKVATRLRLAWVGRLAPSNYRASTCSNRPAQSLTAAHGAAAPTHAPTKRDRVPDPLFSYGQANERLVILERRMTAVQVGSPRGTPPRVGGQPMSHSACAHLRQNRARPCLPTLATGLGAPLPNICTGRRLVRATSPMLLNWLTRPESAP
jgi:hypothetical protein